MSEQTEDQPVLPEHMCEFEQHRHQWRREVLEFIREHVDPSEVYRLNARDLVFGELLPPAPGDVQQEEWADEHRLAFNLERLVKAVDRGFTGFSLARELAAERE